MITVSMEGVSDAVETIRELISPARRREAQRKLNLENALRQAEIQRLNGEVLMAQAKAEREKIGTRVDAVQAELVIAQGKKTEAEALLLLAQAEKTRIETDKERAALRNSQIELALTIVDKYSPNLSTSDQLEYVIRLLPVLERILNGEIPEIH